MELKISPVSNALLYMKCIVGAHLSKSRKNTFLVSGT